MKEQREERPAEFAERMLNVGQPSWEQRRLISTTSKCATLDCEKRANSKHHHHCEDCSAENTRKRNLADQEKDSNCKCGPRGTSCKKPSKKRLVGNDTLNAVIVVIKNKKEVIILHA